VLNQFEMEDAAEDVSEYEAFRRKRIADNDKVLLSLFGTSDPLEPVPDTSNRGSNTLAKKSSGPPTRKMQNEVKNQHHAASHQVASHHCTMQK
jgi:hypothetical protein